jgi:cell division protein ZapA
MANVSIKFNNKDYLLSCDDGQEESLKKLAEFLDKKYGDLKEKVSLQKSKLGDLSKKFLELKSLAISYKDKKDKEISKLNSEIDTFQKTIEESNVLYESMLDRTTKSLEKIIENTGSTNKVQ